MNIKTISQKLCKKKSWLFVLITLVYFNVGMKFGRGLFSYLWIKKCTSATSLALCWITWPKMMKETEEI